MTVTGWIIGYPQDKAELALLKHSVVRRYYQVKAAVPALVGL